MHITFHIQYTLNMNVFLSISKSMLSTEFGTAGIFAYDVTALAWKKEVNKIVILFLISVHVKMFNLGGVIKTTP